MTKREFIRYKWEEAGFIWEEIKFIVALSGGLQLQHPSLKTTLTGYKEAHDKGFLKGYDFDGNGLKVWNKLLDGVEHNNGWTKIESDDDLPKEHKEYHVVAYPLNGHRNAYFDGDKWYFIYTEYDESKTHKITYDNVTHWRPIINIPNPLY